MPTVAASSTFAQRFTRDESINHPYQVTIVSNDGAGSPTKEGAIFVKAFLPEEVNLDIQAEYDAPFAQGLNQMMPGLGSLARAFGVNMVTQAMTAQVWQGGTEVQFQMPLIFQATHNSYLEVMKPIKDLMRLTMPKDTPGGGLMESPGPHINIEKLKAPVGGKKITSTPTPQNPTTESKEGGGIIGMGKALWSGWGGDSGLLNAAAKNVTSIGESISKEGWLAAINVPINVIKDLKASTNDTLTNLSTQLVNAIEGNISLYIGNYLYIPSIVITDVSPTFNTIIGPDGNPTRAQVQVSFKMFYIPTQADLDVMFWNEGAKPVGAKRITNV